MTDLLKRPLTELNLLTQRREISPVELMEATLARIEARNGELNAFVALRQASSLLAEARIAERRIRRGEARLLEGIPLGVKDVEHAEGLVTTYGCAPFRNNVAERDSVQVERLRAAGAIVVGKTNVPEFAATAITKNLLFGETRNPWNLERTPGGSSGGAAAAIAGGMIPLVTASDGGGSIRLPAAMTGCFGLKPSYGRVPFEGDGLWVIEDTSVRGPLTRTVEDAALHLDAVVGAHPLDPNSLPHPGVSYRQRVRDLPEGLRVGFSPDLGFAVVQSDVAEVVYDAARVFEELGHHFEPVEDGISEMGKDWGMVGGLEIWPKFAHLLPEHEQEFGRGFLEGVRKAVRITPERWGRIRRRREDLNRWTAAMFERFDLLLTPTLPFDAAAARGPYPAETEGRPQPLAAVGTFTIPFNLTWHPAATVRAGFSRAGLPVGLQIVGPRHRDDLVLQAAWAFEQARPWRDDWPEG